MATDVEARQPQLPRIDFSGVDPSAPRWWTRWPRSAASTRTTRRWARTSAPRSSTAPSSSSSRYPTTPSARAFADLMWPDGDNAGFCEAVHGAARRIAELEEAVQRMVMEGLGVPGYHDAMRESTIS
ncbi:putative 2-oxoglutarate-dependent dioxygenase AOP1 [Panicum miliaceum]|uniref:2-oxoglutarate-dependent dioxygenase AOP1 n=1 Tax=Panicum miliaceum TaxID=4540 RepID=A0A3L6S4N5_PANMI|nr:putative 2-oxoglutarate-dependent dioxygenase AOP1 [Panicum miliaceum]